MNGKAGRPALNIEKRHLNVYLDKVMYDQFSELCRQQEVQMSRTVKLYVLWALQNNRVLGGSVVPQDLMLEEPDTRTPEEIKIEHLEQQISELRQATLGAGAPSRFVTLPPGQRQTRPLRGPKVEQTQR